MRRPALLVLVLLAGLVAGACRTQGVGSASARQRLRAAIDKTLAAKSLHVELLSQPTSQLTGADSRTSVDLNVPDRARLVSSDALDEVTIEIGTTIYTPDIRRPGYFVSSAAPAGHAPAASFLLPLKAIRATAGVRTVGTDFVVSVDGPSSMTATVTVRDGYVARLRWRGGQGDFAIDLTYEFSRFNAAQEVTAPPSDKVTPAPACVSAGSGSDGGALCVGGNGPHDVDLPHLTAPRSTLQLRPVEGEAPGGCAAADSNPAKSQSATLPRREGGCLRTAPAALELSEVKSLRATSTDGSDITLDITLEDNDGPRLDELAGTNLEHQIALVIFGRVVSAPTVYTAQFNGRMQISGLTLDDAARIKAALLP